MGFLGRLFGAPKARQYTIDEAMKIIENGLSKLQFESLEQSYQNAMKVYWEMSQLSHLINEFHEKPVPEMGKSSANVKERFCTLSKKQLSSMGTPEKDMPHDFLQMARLTMDNLGGLTQRQVLHINFFFKNDFRPVAKKINEINSILSQNAGTSDHQKAVDIHRRMEQLEKQKKRIELSVVEHEDKYKDVKDKRRVLPEVPRHPDTHNLNVAEAKLSSKKQEIDSFLSVQKTLKKYIYLSEIKNRIAEAYIESPSGALLMDENLSILTHLSNASALAGEGKMESDKKLEVIISAAPYLRTSREELTGLLESHKLEKKKYFEDLEDFESSIKSRTNLLADLEAEEKNLEKTIKSEKEEAESMDREITGLHTELLLLASRILEADVI